MNLPKRLMELQTLGAYEIKDQKFSKLIEQVMTRIPEEYEPEFPCFDIYETTFKAPGKFAGVGGPSENLVYFDVKKIRTHFKSDDEIIGIIAHEFAHVFLEHAERDDPFDPNLNEDEADKLASDWGFEKEIKAIRKKLAVPFIIMATNRRLDKIIEILQKQKSQK